MPKDIMQSRQDAPRTESMKEDFVGIRRLIRVELIKQSITGMARIDELQHLALQHFDLFVVQQTNPGDIPILTIEFHLFIAQPKLGQINRRRKEIPDRLVVLRQVVNHLRNLWIKTKKAASFPHRSPRPLFNLPGGLSSKSERSLEAGNLEHIREYTHANRCKPSSTDAYGTEQQPQQASAEYDPESVRPEFQEHNDGHDHD